MPHNKMAYEGRYADPFPTVTREKEQRRIEGTSDKIIYPALDADAILPSEAKARKEIPLSSGVLDYFPSALIEVAKVSYAGNQQHNPGQPLHWARGKSMDQSDTLLRHFIERGKIDTDGLRHSAKMAWRALAILQLELEAEGAPVARGAVLEVDEKIQIKESGRPNAW